MFLSISSCGWEEGVGERERGHECVESGEGRRRMESGEGR